MQIVLDGVGHRFPGGQELFGSITRTLHSGALHAIMGPSGSGKSTLLGIMAGWIEPTSGTIHRENLGKISWVFQNPHGVARRTTLDHVVLPLLGQGRRRREAETIAKGLLEDVNLAAQADHEFRTLSGGEGQRLMLARALASAPDLLLVDEPTAQLDPHTAGETISVLSELSGRDCIVVVATHDARMRSVSDHVIDLTA